MKHSLILFAIACVGIVPPFAHGQKAPEAGYIFPPGGKAGTTVEVQLGGYDWTTDMEFFVHDKRVQLNPTGPLGPILIPGPPYWFGAKGRLASQPLAREVPARLVLPADLRPGPLHWQAANANGGTSPGIFIVSTGVEAIEVENRMDPQLLASVPIAVSGRLLKNEEVDRYRFSATKDGPITCELMARQLGSKFLGILEVHDGKGHLLADALGTNGADPSLTFAAKAGAEYFVSIRDIDFGGDRSYTYRLLVTPGPRVLGAIPAAGQRGEAREVEFVGLGIGSGAARLEWVKRQLAFPATGNAFDYRLETPWGTSATFSIPLTDVADALGTPRHFKKAGLLSAPAALTGVLDRADGEDRYTCSWKKGDVWSIAVEARAIGSPLDVALAVVSSNGKELARNDDLPGTTDAGLDFTAPADGAYQIVVSDMAGKSGNRAAIYRLVVRQAVSGFTLQTPAQRVRVPLGGKFDLAVKAVRTGGFQGPIALTIEGLPPGISAPPGLEITKDKSDLTIPLTAAKDAGTGAGLVTVVGKAMVAGAAVTRIAHAPITSNLAARGPEDSRVAPILVAATLKPLFKGQPVDQDTGRKVPRGSTHPAEVIVERLEGYSGEITLQMAATQSYQHQGITGGDVVVPPGVKKTIYPCFMPEWLETTRTSRMGMIGVAKVPDPKGKLRYAVNDMTGFITMTMEGALLKVSSEESDMIVPFGQPFKLHLKVARLAKLAEPVQLELRLPTELAGQLKAEPMTVPVGKEAAVLTITPTSTLRGLHTFAVRATALQNGKYLVVSETEVAVEFLAAAQAPR